MMSPLFSIAGRPSADPAGVYLVSSGEGVTKKRWVSHLLPVRLRVSAVAFQRPQHPRKEI